MDESEMSMSEMGHSNHNMDMMMTDNQSDGVSSNDCCDMDCECSIGSCSSNYITQTSHYNIVFSQISNSAKSNDRFVTSVEKSSLYRPPIAS